MKNKREIKQLAKKIIDIELKLAESYDSKLMIEMENLMKNLTINELIALDEEINKHMGISYPQKNIWFFKKFLL